MKYINRRTLLGTLFALPFICLTTPAPAQSEVTISHYFTGELGLKAFGEQMEKGHIEVRTRPSVILEGLLHGCGNIDQDISFNYNLSYEYFKKRKFHFTKRVRKI